MNGKRGDERTHMSWHWMLIHKKGMKLIMVTQYQDAKT